jgi:hypothetical protein
MPAPRVYLENDRLETLLNNYGVFAFTSATVPNTASGTVDLYEHRRRHGRLPDRPSQCHGPGFARRRQRELLELWLLCAGRLAHGPQADRQSRRALRRADSTGRYPAPHRRLCRPACSRRSPRLRCSANSSRAIPACQREERHQLQPHLAPHRLCTFDPYGSGKTVFHGGAGLFFDTISGNEWMLSQNFQPFAVRETSCVYPRHQPCEHLPIGLPGLCRMRLAVPVFLQQDESTVCLSGVAGFVQQGMRWPYNIQANFGVQQQFGRDVAVTINYVGAFSRKIPLYIDQNAPIYNTANVASNTTGDVNCRRPYDALPFRHRKHHNLRQPRRRVEVHEQWLRRSRRPDDQLQRLQVSIVSNG